MDTMSNLRGEVISGVTMEAAAFEWKSSEGVYGSSFSRLLRSKRRRGEVTSWRLAGSKMSENCGCACHQVSERDANSQ